MASQWTQSALPTTEDWYPFIKVLPNHNQVRSLSQAAQVQFVADSYKGMSALDR